MAEIQSLAERIPAATPCGDCAADCLEACFNDAIVAVASGGVRILEDNCAGCGACAPACDFGVISVRDGVARIVLPKTPRRIAGSPLPAPNLILE